MGRMKDADAPNTVRLKIETLGLTVEQLARQKAEALQSIFMRQQDSAAYRLQAANERSKANSLKEVLFKLRERQRNPIANPSRMDPLNSYDTDQVKTDLALAVTRSKEFEQLANQYNQDAERHSRTVMGLDERIMKLNREGKLREADEIIPDGRT